MMFDFKIHTQIQNFELNVHCQTAASRLAIVGASGSGKSLTLHILAGLLRPQMAHICINQHLFAHDTLWLPASKRQLGVVFQDYALFPHLTVAQNIAFGLQRNWRNPPKRHIHTQTEHWLNKMQLKHVAHHYPHQISGGQKQRTALARACITQPCCLLLDEPFSALDTDLRQQMRLEVAVLQQELNIPMLLISHDAADTDVLADEIWHMEQGQLFQAA